MGGLVGLFGVEEDEWWLEGGSGMPYIGERWSTVGSCAEELVLIATGLGRVLRRV